MNEAEKENKHLIHNEQDRQHFARRRTQRILEEIQVHNNSLTTTPVVENDHPALIGVAPLNSMDENLSKKNEYVGCGIKIQRSNNEIFGNSYQNLQILFRRQLDNLVMPIMCYMCQEYYVSIKVKSTYEAPMCSRCQQEKGNNKFLTDNNMDLGS